MKIAIFLMMAIAALGALGVTTAIMSSTTPVHAVSCHGGPPGSAQVCPPGSLPFTSKGFVCTPNTFVCRNIGH